MKRSEMVENLKEYLWRSFPEYSNDVELYAKSLLDWIEQCGMLPPAEYHEQDREAKVHCNNAMIWMKWESEDE